MLGKRAHGIDISHYQEELRTPPDNGAEIDFVILKASQAQRVDTAFERLYVAAKAFPLRGAYHYFITKRFRTSELLEDTATSPKKVKGEKIQGGKGNKAKDGKFKGPEATVLFRGKWTSVPKARVRISVVEGPSWQEQADFFLGKVVGKDINFFALDVERGPAPETHIGFEHNIFTSEDVRNIKDWINYVKDKTGKPVLLYTNADIYKNELLNHGGQILIDLELWLAGYPDTPKRDEQDPVQFFKLPAKNWRFWQYSADKNAQGAAYGVKSPDIDLDVFNGTREELLAWLALDAGAAGKTAHVDEKPPLKRVVEPGAGEKRIEAAFAQIEQIKKTGLTPVVRIQLHMDEFDIETANLLKERLRESGLAAEIAINVELELEADGGARMAPLPDGKKAREPLTVPGGSSGEGAADRKSTTESGTEEKPAAGANVEDSFTVVVTEMKALVQSIKNRDKSGKPIMMPREPRIRLPQGTRISVSATHKASDKDAGDGNIHGTGNLLYYCITDCPLDREAEGFYVRQADVSRA